MKVDIEYNTEREDIIYPEYGRSIQEMLQYAKTIEEPGKRQKTVESIITLMMLLNPGGNRNMDDYREKLWNHAFAIADYELDVTPPSGVVIRREEDRPVAEPVGYPASATRFRHYGNGIQALIKKAIEMPEGPKKEGFVEVIASYMKLAYKTWNREHYVSDDIVKEDLEILSDGQLALHEGHDSLDKLAAGAGKHDKERRQQNQRGRKQNNNSGNRNRKRGNYGNNYRKRKK
ncbi:MAG: DUF4290 domain-containing protein [Lewinellaceae bacterium]|nr:DUF4290 domain-containing protein [Lewinellaceae bacterium]MCB9355521.1 DUF4290 domain-containing protein [Lewinellaceae bacterium]